MSLVLSFESMNYSTLMPLARMHRAAPLSRFTAAAMRPRVCMPRMVGAKPFRCTSTRAHFYTP